MIPSKVQAVLDALRKAGYEAYVAGGAARDLHYGRTPKDWDILLIQGPEWGEVQAIATKVYGCDPYAVHGDDQYLDLPSDNWLDYVIQFNDGGGVAIDIIQYADDPATIEDQVRLFDCNLSYFWLDVEGNVCHTEDAHTVQRYAQHKLVEFTGARGATPARRDYLSAKFPTCVFPNDEELYVQLTKGV